MAQLPISRREQLPWVILRLGKHHLALSAGQVREMAALPAVTEMPGTSPLLRGMIDLRGEVLPLLDLRRLLGLPSLRSQAEQMEQVLIQQIQAHRQWLAGLEAAVAAERPCDLPLEAAQCPFGRWYAGFTTDDPVLIAQMATLDAPHRQVHQAAREVDELLQAGMGHQARQALRRHQAGTLSHLLRSLQAVRQNLAQRQREIAVVLDSPRAAPLALAVDEVEAVEQLISGGGGLDQAELGSLNHRLLAGVAQRLPGRELVFLLDLESLRQQGRELAARVEAG